MNNNNKKKVKMKKRINLILIVLNISLFFFLKTLIFFSFFISNTAFSDKPEYLMMALITPEIKDEYNVIGI